MKRKPTHLALPSRLFSWKSLTMDLRTRRRFFRWPNSLSCKAETRNRLTRLDIRSRRSGPGRVPSPASRAQMIARFHAGSTAPCPQMLGHGAGSSPFVSGSRLITTKDPARGSFVVSRDPESNRVPAHYECAALPSELSRRVRLGTFAIENSRELWGGSRGKRRRTTKLITFCAWN